MARIKGSKMSEEAKAKRDAKFLEKHGITYDEFIHKIASKGGKNGHTGGFASNRELASLAGTIGGLHRLGWRKHKENN